MFSLEEGDRVLVDNKEGNVFSNLWEVGEIIATHRSKDGHIRSVTVKTPRGSFRRGINRVAVTEEAVLNRSPKGKSSSGMMALGGV
jgi:hypothetical protein